MLITPVLLEGTFVRLEPMSLHHLDALCEVGLDERLWALTMTMIRTKEDMKGYVETALKEQAEGKSLPFVTVLKSEGEVVGSSRFGNIDRVNRRAEIGWTWIAVPWQRSVVNTEAKLLMLTHAFETLGLIRVELKTDKLNEKSRAALTRIGAKEEGIFRNHQIVPHTGRIRDSVYFSIIDSEWPDVKRRLKARLGRQPTVEG
jgi:RimJ/RimL family protein N-acetyltransferase